MAKNKILRKSAEQYDIEETYMKVRKRLQANVRSLVKRGYNVPDNYVPSIPKRITEASIRNLEKLNKERYKKSTKLAYDYEKHDVVEISGKRARVREIREATQKAELTKYARKKGYESYEQYKQSYEYRKTKLENEKFQQEYYYDRSDDQELYTTLTDAGISPYEAYKIANNEPTIEQTKGQYIDVETGEILDTLSGGPITVMPNESFNEALYNNLMNELERLSQYEGSDKHAKDTRVNAQQIKNYIEQMDNTKRNELLPALNQMFNQGQLLSPQMYYRTGGYNDFIYKLGQAVDYVETVQGYGDMGDESAYSVYEDAED